MTVGGSIPDHRCAASPITGRAKDAATTQAALGFKICGMQVGDGDSKVVGGGQETHSLRLALTVSPKRMPSPKVFRHGAGGYWRASKRWCKTLPAELVDKALLSFAHNGGRAVEGRLAILAGRCSLCSSSWRHGHLP
jgi:hypothetical protein